MIAIAASTESGCCIFCAKMEKSGAIWQCARSNRKHRYLRYHGKVRLQLLQPITACTHTNAMHAHGYKDETQHSCTLADVPVVACSDPALHVPYQHFAKFLQRCVHIFNINASITLSHISSTLRYAATLSFNLAR